MSVLLSLIAPCFNEEDNVRELAERFLREAKRREVSRVEVVFVNDGSVDDTSKVLEGLRAQFPEVRIVSHRENRGIPTSWLDGLEAAEGEFACLIDSDLQNPPELAFDLLERIDEQEQVLVQGVRRPVSNVPKTRVLMSRALNTLLNLVFQMNSRDNKSGFVLARRADLLHVVTHERQYRHFQTFIGVAAHSRGLKIIEVDTTFEDRRKGDSFLSKRTINVACWVLIDIFRAKREFGKGVISHVTSR